MSCAAPLYLSLDAWGQTFELTCTAAKRHILRYNTLNTAESVCTPPTTPDRWWPAARRLLHRHQLPPPPPAAAARPCEFMDCPWSLHAPCPALRPCRQASLVQMLSRRAAALAACAAAWGRWQWQPAFPRPPSPPPPAPHSAAEPSNQQVHILQTSLDLFLYGFHCCCGPLCVQLGNRRRDVHPTLASTAFAVRSDKSHSNAAAGPCN